MGDQKILQLDYKKYWQWCKLQSIIQHIHRRVHPKPFLFNGLWRHKLQWRHIWFKLMWV